MSFIFKDEHKVIKIVFQLVPMPSESYFGININYSPEIYFNKSLEGRKNDVLMSPEK